VIRIRRKNPSQKCERVCTDICQQTTAKPGRVFSISLSIYLSCLCNGYLQHPASKKREDEG
jgi:hypothetical protein